MVDFDLLIKYFAGQADPEETMHIEEWAQASPDHHAYFTSLHQSWLEAGNEVYHLPDVKKEWLEFDAKNNITSKPQINTPQKTSWFTRIAAAATITGTAVAGYYMFNTDNQNTATIIVGATDRIEQVQLMDGTKVLLQPAAELVYPIQFKPHTREVTLVGNGSFNVNHDANRPFIVHLGDVHVKVTGTSFDVERKKGWINVKINTGKVAFYNKSDTIQLSAGYTGKYDKVEKKFSIEAQKPHTGSFHFLNTPLSQVVTELNNYFKVNIRLQNAALNNCQLSGGFEQQSLDYLLKAITETFNLNYKIGPTYIEIDGKACR